MKKRVIGTLLVLCMSAGLLAGCGDKTEETSGQTSESSSQNDAAGQDNDEKTDIKLGVRASSLEQGELAAAAYEEMGYTVEIVTFDDNIAPNVALAEGSIDANMYQHEPYLINYNENEGTDLVMVSPKIQAPVFGLYSEQYDDYNELPDGAVIGLCNDATNQERALRMLEELGLLKLDDSVDAPTMYNVTENPKNFEFIEAEMALLPQSIEDVDAIALAAQHMHNAGKDAASHIATSTDEEEYAVGLVVRSGDETSQWAKDLNGAFMTEEMRKFLEEEYGGATLPLF